MTESTGDQRIWLVRGLLSTWQVLAHFIGEINTGIFVALHSMEENW